MAPFNNGGAWPTQVRENAGSAHLQAEVGKDKGLGEKGGELEEAAQRDLGVGSHAVVGVVRMEHSAEKERHYPGQLQHLRQRTEGIWRLLPQAVGD